MARGYEYSTRSCVEAGTSLVGQFLDMFEEFTAGGQLHMVRWMMNSFTVNDFLLGVMVLCEYHKIIIWASWLWSDAC